MRIGRRTYRLLSATTLTAILSLGGCSKANPQEPGAGVITIRGRLTAEGVECPAMRSDDDRLYTLLGDLKGAQLGDRVIVEGVVAQVSTCMQGTPLQLRKIQIVR